MNVKKYWWVLIVLERGSVRVGFLGNVVEALVDDCEVSGDVCDV